MKPLTHRHNYSRRNFLKFSVLAATTLASSQSLIASAASSTTAGKNRLKLKIGGYDYYRVAPLITGQVEVEGCDIEFTNETIGNLNTIMFDGPQTFDVSEVGLHPYMLAVANHGFSDYTLLPIFPLRTFRHKSVFVRTDSGINKPEDLRGKRIATPGYSSTSLTWLRGIFQDEYGISSKDVEWVISAKDSSKDLSGGASGLENMLPTDINVSKGSEGKDESDLLESGEIDALFHAIEPRGFVEGDPKIARLFPDSRAVEQDYYAKTKIFPIMHVLAIRKTTLQENPWLAQALFDAYSKAKQLYYKKMAKKHWAWDALPWYSQELDSTIALMGKNFYSYGMSEANQKTLEALFRYSYDQGLSSRKLTIEEMFAPEGLKLLEPY